jgi:hypothetical protein
LAICSINSLIRHFVSKVFGYNIRDLQCPDADLSGNGDAGRQVGRCSGRALRFFLYQLPAFPGANIMPHPFFVPGIRLAYFPVRIFPYANFSGHDDLLSAVR